MSAERPLVSVVIVSYNTCAMTLECLETLYGGADEIEIETFVVDNGSADGSVEAIGRQFPKTRVIANTDNPGFGAANNQAMRTAHGEYFLLLNSDAFLKPGAIVALVRYLERHPETAAVGPRLQNRDGSLQRSCYRFASPGRAWLENLWIASLFAGHPILGDYRRWPHDRERSVDYVIGACMLVRRKVFEQIGGFDEGFFMYSEEADWQKRMRDNGWQIGFTPQAVAMHLGGASGAGERARIDRCFFESLDRYERKHHGAIGLVSLRLAMTIGCALRAILWSLVYLTMPGRRALAASKARMHAWLVLRQATYWRPDRTKPT